MKVLITVPTTGTIRNELAGGLFAMAATPGVEVSLLFQDERPYEHNLNLLAKRAIQSDADYWLTIDGDQVPMRNPMELCRLGLPIVSCPAPFWKPVGDGFPVLWNAFDRIDDQKGYKVHAPAIGLQEVDAVGSGALLLRRDVFEQLERPFAIDWDSTGGILRGPDLAFSRRAKEAGFPIYVHYDYPCQHFVTVDMAEVGSWIANRIGVGTANG